MENKKEVFKKFDNDRFEFILYVNNNIVCQRGFHIFDFDEDMTNMKEMLDEVSGMHLNDLGRLGIIPTFLKKQSNDYMWSNYNPYIDQSQETYKSPPKKMDEFKFQFLLDKEVRGESIFPNEFFYLSLKVNVNIKEIIPEIISEIRQSFSNRKFIHKK
jgi:hypothetical protein